MTTKLTTRRITACADCSRDRHLLHQPAPLALESVSQAFAEVVSYLVLITSDVEGLRIKQKTHGACGPTQTLRSRDWQAGFG